MPAASVIRPGATIGILGAGQLGRMLALAAAQLGLKTHLFAPETGPAHDVATAHTLADYSDREALARFARAVAVVTYEFENVPAATADFLMHRCPVRPGPLALATSQDRLTEKLFLRDLSIPTAAFADVPDMAALSPALAAIGTPAILKSRRHGYDGKGQVLIREGDDAAAAFEAIGGHPAILERVVGFAREISVVAARGQDGEFAAFDIAENEHANHVLARSILPAAISATTAAAATAIAARIAEALDYVGILAVEMFVLGTPDRSEPERLVINELAPRVHNSGHWTLDGAVTSQFEQHIRAICGWPLGSPRRDHAVEMRNLLGDDVLRWREILADPEARLHLYAKTEPRPGRKMGHVTRVIVTPK